MLRLLQRVVRPAECLPRAPVRKTCRWTHSRTPVHRSPLAAHPSSPPLPQDDRTQSSPSVSSACIHSRREWQDEPNLPRPNHGRLPTPECGGRVSSGLHTARYTAFQKSCAATHCGAHFRLRQLTAAGALGRLMPVDKKHQDFPLGREQRSWGKAALPTSVLEFRSTDSMLPV